MTQRLFGSITRGLALLLLLAVAFAVPGGPELVGSSPLTAAGPLDGEETAADADTATDEDEEHSSAALPLLGGGSDGGSGGGSRPRVTSEPSGPVDRESAPAALVRPIMVSASVSFAGRNAPLVVPDEALPWRFWVERSLADRFGGQAVVDSVRQWDGIPGSRWATAYAGILEERHPKAVADGRSVVFAQADCPAGVGGYAYWQTATSTADARYGDAAVYLTEVDIGVCAAVQSVDALRAVLAHEVGHALGLEHLCDPGQPCWQTGMGQGPHGCRVMYVASSTCSKTIGEAERLAAIHKYPTLRRLAGPSRVETAARASFAAFQPGEAQTVVLARSDKSAHGPLAAVALSGTIGGPLLIGAPAGVSCLTGAAAEELARVAADPGRVVLVGDWPQACEAALSGWGLAVERVGPSVDPVGLGVAVADRLASTGRMGDAVFVVSARADAAGHVPDGVAAGAAAGSVNAPILYTNPDGLAAPVDAWLRMRGNVRRAYVMGGQAALSEQVVEDLRALGIEVVRVGGSTRVATAMALGARTELFPPGRPVVLASANGWADAVTGSSTGARLGAPVLVTPAQPDAGLEQWLAARRPIGGFVVGGNAAVPFELQWRYARHVR